MNKIISDIACVLLLLTFNSILLRLVSFQRNKSLAGFVKYIVCVKYCFASEIRLRRVKCAAAREGFISFHFSHKRKKSQFLQDIIWHPKNNLLHIPSFWLYNQFGKAVFLCRNPGLVIFLLR
ncbi:MAG: hypothetical protein PUC05_07850 [Firmicutes bacterium]|nr:hypothetical protein [Bacillota bacterium]